MEKNKSNNTKSEVEKWLKHVFSKEDIVNVSANILGNTEKGDGYMSDIVFVELNGKTSCGLPKHYSLVLKCGKRSKILRDTAPVREAFLNEIRAYKVIFPTFSQFQLEKGIKDIFDSVPRCYGTFLYEDMEVIVLEDLKALGYDLWDKKKPMPLKHINMILESYGKWHAISVAMNDQQPERFKLLVKDIVDVIRVRDGFCDFKQLFGSIIDETYSLLVDDLEEAVLKRWKNLGQVDYVGETSCLDSRCVKVLIHGDSWNNNFMFKHERGDIHSLSKVAMLDWQILEVSSPVFDVSYFLYSSISEEDLNHFNAILKAYYKYFSNHVRRLGSNPEKLYPFTQLLGDWKKFARYGILRAALGIKVSQSDKDEVIDVAENAEKGHDFSKTFTSESKNKSQLKERIVHIIKHVVERDFI